MKPLFTSSAWLLIATIGTSTLAHAEFGDTLPKNERHLMAEVSQVGDPASDQKIVCLNKYWLKNDFKLASMYKRLVQNFQAKERSFDETLACFETWGVPQENIDSLYARVREMTSKVEMPQDQDVQVSMESIDQKKTSKWKRMNPYLKASILINASMGLGLGAIYAMPKDSTGWKERSSFKKLWQSWTNAPVWDKDAWWVNYVLHPMTFGANSYLSVREQGKGPVASWLFATAQSLLWEFVAEAFAERASAQDLIFTSNGGALLGEGFHHLTRLMAKNGFRWYEKIAVTIINPSYVVFHGYHAEHIRDRYGDPR